MLRKYTARVRGFHRKTGANVEVAVSDIVVIEIAVAD
jgi:hypothetical protein